MNFPAILDVGLGLVVVFFLLASICSILVEIIANWLKWRHATLKITVNALLKGHEERTGEATSPSAGQPEGDAKLAVQINSKGESMEELFWAHPEIEPLRAADTASPAYIDEARFANVVLDIATGKGADGVIPDSRASFSRAFEKYASPKLRERLSSLLRNLPAETLEVRAEITAALARWYNEAMARSTGSYKRKVQKSLFWSGLVVALILNCDALRISYVLFRDPGLRSSMVDYAKSISVPAPAPTNQAAVVASTNLPANALATNATLTDVVSTNASSPNVIADLRLSLQKQLKELQKLERIGFPIGWVAPFSANFLPFHAGDEPINGNWIGAAIFLKIIGLFATAFAVCLGAPFWFDLLNKLLKLRTLSAKTGADSGGDSTATVTPSPNSSAGVSASTSAGTTPRPTKPLLAIGEALREPSTQFQAAKAYWLAEASLLAYAAEAEIMATVINVWRFERMILFNDTATNTQGFLAVGGGVAILAFRGTEPKQLPDWETDAHALLMAQPAEYPGEIHSGFATALAGVYTAIEREVKTLPGSGSLLYVTGHSLGAALATLCAHRLKAARVYPVQGVCTYGSPRVGNAEFAQSYETAIGSRTFRVVNNEDLVTRVAPRAVGYEHVGEMVYIDETGRLQRDIGFWYRFLNLVANAAADFKQAAKTTVRDHSMSLYCEHLKRASITPDK